MNQRLQRIIGINPGTRYLGIAVLDGSELLDWRIKVLDGEWSYEKIKKALGILSGFIEHYETGILAIKKLHPSRRSKNLAQLVERIKAFSRMKGLRVTQYSIKDLEEVFIQKKKLNTKNLAEAIVSENPSLFHELQKEEAHKNAYYGRVFEAVALALAFSQRLGKYRFVKLPKKSVLAIAGQVSRKR